MDTPVDERAVYSVLAPAPPVRLPTPPQVPVDGHPDRTLYALARVAEVLAADAEAGMEDALAALGDALGADAVSFRPSTPRGGAAAGGGAGWHGTPSADALTWTRAPLPEEDARSQADSNTGPWGGRGGAAGLDVPVVARDGRPVGALAVEGDGLPSPSSPTLALLGGVLGACWCRPAPDDAPGGRWRHVLDGHPAPTLVVVEGRVAYANRRAARLVGVAGPSEIEGRPFDDVVPPADAERVARARAAQVSADRPAPFEHAVAGLDGSGRVVESLSVPCPGVAGGVLTVLRDVTGRAEPRLLDALDEQQRRIGQDLHDSVGQLLTGVRMLSEGLAEAPALARAPGDLDETARRIAGYSTEALDRVRSICRGLVPPPLGPGEFAGALADLVEDVDALSPTRCVFHHEGDADFPAPGVALQVYRIVQEALSNALRHAGAAAVWVTLGRDGDGVAVEVEDNGAGFVVGADRARSVGLHGMGLRARSVGATLGVESRPGAGTTVRVTVPAGGRQAREEATPA